MGRNRLKECWEDYCRELENANNNKDITGIYVENDNLFADSTSFEEYQGHNCDIYKVSEEEGEHLRFMFPGGSPSGGGQSPAPMVSPGGGQFTVNNCRRMPIVRIDMRRGFNPSNFFMVVDRTDNRSIRGFRIACEGGRVRFVPMAVEYRNINVIECAF